MTGKSFLLKLDGREEGPVSDTQIAQMFADQQVNRSTPCKPQSGGEWRTIDDYLPTLKYGTQLPSPTPRATPPRASTPAVAIADQRVAVVDFDMPFGSILRMMFKMFAAWMIVLICFIPVIVLFWVLFAAVITAALGSLTGQLR